MLDNAKNYVSVVRLFNRNRIKCKCSRKIAKINCKTCKNSLKNVKKLEKKIEKRLMVVKTIEQKILH